MTDELRRELSWRSLPVPARVEWTQEAALVPPVRWASFTRSRKGQHPRPGYGAILSFDEPVEGPFLVGALSHYGMGRFEPSTLPAVDP